MSERLPGAFAWLIERRGSQVFAPEYLYVTATGFAPDYGHFGSGSFGWTSDPLHALRFSRKEDAALFASAFVTLSDLLPHKATLSGLRAGDDYPRICEHGFLSKGAA